MLLITKLARSGNNLVITWSIVSNHVYFIQRSSNLGAQPAFLPLGTNLVGPGSSTSYPYTDTTATNSGPYFYRVGIQ